MREKIGIAIIIIALSAYYLLRKQEIANEYKSKKQEEVVIGYYVSTGTSSTGFIVIPSEYSVMENTEE